jgi:hypothetical protein
MQQLLVNQRKKQCYIIAACLSTDSNDVTTTTAAQNLQSEVPDWAMRRSKGLRSTPAVSYTQRTNAGSASSQASEQQQQHSVSDSTAVSDSNTTAAAAADPSKNIMQYAADPALEQWRLHQNSESSP